MSRASLIRRCKDRPPLEKLAQALEAVRQFTISWAGRSFGLLSLLRWWRTVRRTFESVLIGYQLNLTVNDHHYWRPFPVWGENR